MIKIKTFLFLLILAISPLMAASYKYELTACMIFKDEAPYLKEWIEFHRLVGIEHFYLYNNLSEDNYREVLQPYIDNGIVELTEWPYASNNVTDWDAIQIAAYKKAFKKAKKESKWLTVLDSDEFLFPAKKSSLKEYLKKYENVKGLGGICSYWVMYGTSGVEKIPDDQLLIETLIRSSGDVSDHFKSIYLTSKVDYICTPHHAIYKKGYQHHFHSTDKIRTNHYWPRDEWYLNNFKIPRRIKWGTPAETCLTWSSASNNIIDDSIFRFIEPLRERMP